MLFMTVKAIVLSAFSAVINRQLFSDHKVPSRRSIEPYYQSICFDYREKTPCLVPGLSISEIVSYDILRDRFSFSIVVLFFSSVFKLQFLHEKYKRYNKFS